MNIAAGGKLVGIEIGMRIQPQHTQLFTHAAAMRGHRRDRTNRQAMVTAQQNRHPPGLQLTGGHIKHATIPRGDFIQMPIAIDRRTDRIAWATDIAYVTHIHAAGGNGIHQPCHTQSLRPHGCATLGRADIRRNTEDGHRWIATLHTKTP